MKIRQIALCDWCHQRCDVASGVEADRWLRNHDCPEAVRKSLTEPEDK